MTQSHGFEPIADRPTQCKHCGLREHNPIHASRADDRFYTFATRIMFALAFIALAIIFQLEFNLLRKIFGYLYP